MRLSKSDVIASSIGIIALTVLSYLLYADITRLSGAGGTAQIGTLKSKRNVAERKYSSKVVWDEVAKNTKLYNFDTIRTADRSEAVVRLKDGTEITLNENSMVLLTYTEKEVDIQFMQGAINAKQAAATGAGSRNVNIVSGNSKISLNNSDVSLLQDKDKQLQVTVNRGKATFSSENEQKVLDEHQNIMAGKDGIRLNDLAIKLISPENNAYIITTTGKAAVNFTWEPLKGNYDTLIEIARNPSLMDPLIKKKAAGTRSAATLTEEIYYWRVTAVDKATKKIETSEVRKLSVVNNRPVELIAPANKSNIKFWDTNPMINFIWSRNESVPRYTLLISSTQDMSSPFVNTIVEGNKISLNSLGRGNYYWRIINVPDIADAGKTAQSAVFTFAVSKTDKLPPPEPISPTDRKTFHPLAIAQKGINFTWKTHTSTPEAEIIIAGDKEFSNIVLKKTSGDNSIRFEQALKEGVYYWNLRGITSTGSATDASPARSFRVAREGGIKLIEPADKTVIYSKKGKEAEMAFSWSKAELEGKYLLQVAKNRNFTAPVKEISANDPSAVVPNIGDGLSYWRVKLIDEKSTEILSSPVYSFELLNKIEPPVAVAPRPGSTVNMLNKDALEFQWKAVKGANLYRIGLYHIINGIQHSITTAETNKTSYQFTDLKKLDEGSFLWSLQALDADEASHREKRKSEESKMAFDIVLGSGEKKIKIKSPKILYLE